MSSAHDEWSSPDAGPGGDSSVDRNGKKPGAHPYDEPPSEEYYDMSGQKILVILNHYSYKKTQYFGSRVPPTRTGTLKDAMRLREVFQKLGFMVKQYTDSTHDQITGIITGLCKEEHRGTSCVIVVVMTHGHSDGELAAVDRWYPLSDITSPFEAHPQLVHKPKLFFIQACRGGAMDGGVQVDGEARLRLPSHANFLLMYSTVEGYVSWRDSDGSWLMQELCTAVEQRHATHDLLHIAAAVQNRIAYHYRSNTQNQSSHDKLQMPETRFTLTKLLKFTTV